MLWLMVIRPVCLGVKHRFRAQGHMTLTFAGLLMCGAYLILETGIVFSNCRCSHQPSHVGSQSSGNHRHVSLSEIQDSPMLEDQAPIFMSSTDRVAQICPQALGSLFVASYHSQFFTELLIPLYNPGTDRTENARHVIACSLSSSENMSQ
jgi:hypothetical protein